MSEAFDEAVGAVIASLDPGEVTTYGEVAAEAGFPGAARAVGTFLRRRGRGLPWWRVVTAAGRLVPGNEAEHARHLAAEGVATRDGHVVMDRGGGAACPDGPDGGSGVDGVGYVRRR